MPPQVQPRPGQGNQVGGLAGAVAASAVGASSVSFGGGGGNGKPLLPARGSFQSMSSEGSRPGSVSSSVSSGLAGRLTPFAAAAAGAMSGGAGGAGAGFNARRNDPFQEQQREGEKPASRPGVLFDVVAISDFVAQEDDDLGLSVGDRVGVVEDVDENWYRGTLRGKKGIFPKSFVKRC
ncbi:hypothetical protein HK102_013329 [Quaeritorhiza haematococci]|nr:hypothetical protein HK102_013329 [Quaeritorhiza haematococci]